MPAPKRKPKNTGIVVVEKAVSNTADCERLKQAAGAFELDPRKLLAYRIYPSGKVVMIAANGMKFVYEAHDGT